MNRWLVFSLGQLSVLLAQLLVGVISWLRGMEVNIELPPLCIVAFVLLWVSLGQLLYATVEWWRTGPQETTK